MSYLFHVIFYQPILNLVVFLYNIIPGADLGIAIIVLTIIIKLALYPLTKKSLQGQKALQDMQPKIDELKKKYAGKQDEMGRAMLELYKENKVNPFSSCLPLLIQLPFLWAVFKVLRSSLNAEALNALYPFIHRPEIINTTLFGFTDLSKPNIILAVLAGVAQFWQAKSMMTKKPVVKGEGSTDENMAAIMNKQMMYMMPVLTVVIGWKLPGGLTLYWFVMTLVQVLQQYWMFRKKKDTIQTVIEGEVIKK